MRPAWATQVFRDEDGTVIEYGSRWSDPPKWAYSATSNLDRFAPLHLLADALVSYLAAEYQIVVSEDPDNAQVLDTEPPAFNRSVRLSPEGVSGESMSIIYTSFPGVAVYVGSSYDGIFPVCGCDACDDDINDVVTDLEEHVLSLSRNRLGWSRRT